MTENMVVAIHAIRNFVYFTRNYPCFPKEMCEQIWGKGVEGNHFFHKLESYDYDMTRFFLELSTGNQTKFAEWIMKNYDCGWNKYDQPETKLPLEGPTNTYILFGEEAAAWYSEEGVDAFLEHADEIAFEIKKYHFRDEVDKVAYFNGVADESKGWQGCVEITEDDCQKIENHESYELH